MSAIETSTLVITDEHFLKCIVPTRGRRLLDVLMDKDTEFLAVRDVQVLRRHGGAQSAACAEAIVRKSSIGLTIPASDKHEAPQKRIDTFVSKREHPVFLAVLGYEVRGMMQLNASPDALGIMCRETGDFFPVVQATVSSAGLNWENQPPRVVIVNHAHVSLFQVGHPSGVKLGDGTG